MKFSDIIDQAKVLLQRAERVTYRTLKREFDLDDEALEDLKDELIVARRVAVDEDGKVLMWTSGGISTGTYGFGLPSRCASACFCANAL